MLEQSVIGLTLIAMFASFLLGVFSDGLVIFLEGGLIGVLGGILLLYQPVGPLLVAFQVAGALWSLAILQNVLRWCLGSYHLSGNRMSLGHLFFEIQALLKK